MRWPKVAWKRIAHADKAQERRSGGFFADLERAAEAYADVLIKASMK